MRPLYKSRLFAASLLFSVAVAAAQQTQSTAAVPAVPRLLRYAGYHAAMTQPAGVVGANFAIYGQQEGGAALWSEDQNVELDANGNYTVLLGSTINEGLPVELFTAEEARWLQVKFYLPGEVDLSRMLLVSVPYALKAGDADTLGGRPASAYALAGPSTPAQPEGASAALQSVPPVAAASVETTAVVAPRIASSGSPNYIAKFTDTAGDVANSVMYQNGTSIGINTTASLDILDVAGNITAEVDGGPSSGPTLDLRNTPPTGFGIGSIDFYTYPNQTVPSARWRATDIGGFTADQTLYTATTATGPNQSTLLPRLAVKGGTGYVGIGTTTPVTNLEVNGNAQVDGNLTLTGNILSGSGGVALIYAPNNGVYNFGAGLASLQSVTTGFQNTAVGDNALQANTAGSGNVALGFEALAANTTGGSNTAIGYYTLSSNTIGQSNLANGARALENNTTGTANTASGTYAMTSNTTGYYNTASGYTALYTNTSGYDNTATGYGALELNTTGNSNTAAGFQTLFSNVTGSNNIAIGYEAGYYGTTTSNNIDIGNQGTVTDSGAIRIGTAGTQTTAFIAGIQGVITGNNNAVPVMIDSNGQLGTVSSSRRYKEDIRDMGDSSSGLLRLRPVTFRYKKPFNDGSQPIQYGLIAEEVAEVYPDLVAHSSDGQIETVKYQVLDSMLLNEVLKQNATIAAQKDRIRTLEERLARVEAALERTSLTASSR